MRIDKTIFRYIIVAMAGWYPAASQQVITANISDLINTELNALPGPFTNKYAHPTADERIKWESLVSKVISKTYAEAAEDAAAVGYELVNVKDNGGGLSLNLYLLRKTVAGDNFWGSYVFNNSPDRPQLVIQSPHAIKDRNTGVQGIHVFRETGARAFFLTGTNRCNSSTPTGCSGTTGICGNGTEKYRISDVAHNTDGAFQIATEVLSDAENNYFIQLHGFGKEASDPYAILSLGARILAGGENKMPTIEQHLFDQDNQLTFQNSANPGWTRLLGFTNTQGRYINGGTDPCTTNAATTNGRFIHIEQEYDKLRAGLTQWQKMANALGATFAKSATGTVTEVEGHDNPIQLYPNPVRHLLNLQNATGQILEMTVHTLSGQVVRQASITPGLTTQSVTDLERGIYLYTLSSEGSLVKRGRITRK